MKSTFKIIEFVNLGLHNKNKYYKLEETIIRFEENAHYNITTNLLFEPPKFDRKILHHIYNANNTILEKLKKGKPLGNNEIVDLQNLPATYLICYLNLFDEAIDKLHEIKPYLKAQNPNIYKSYQEAIRILRKIKYS